MPRMNQRITDPSADRIPVQIPMVESFGQGPADSASVAQLLHPDGGNDAWFFLCGAFTIEALVWGFPFSFGVFQQYYSTHPPFDSNPSGIAIIGTLASGLMYFNAPLAMGLIKRFPNCRRTTTSLGLAILSLSLIASSFATSLWQLILTQGILYAFGGCMLYMPTLMLLDEWFVKKKGLALGVTFAGTGVGGVVVPLVMNWALQKYGLNSALRIWAVVLAVFTAPLLYFIKPRIPVPSDLKAIRNQRIDLAFLQQPLFWFMWTGNIIQGVGYFIPTVYLPSYAYSIGFSTIAGSSTLSALNASTVVGQILFGHLSDKFAVTNVLAVSTIGSLVSVFVIWGLSSSAAPLYIFSVFYGFFAGGYSSCWAAIVGDVRKKNPRAEHGLVFGLLASGRGIGCVACGPLSERLLDGQPWTKDGVRTAYGTGYGPLIVFTGATALFGGISYLAKKLRWC